MTTRQSTGFVESLLRLIGLNWAVPDFSTLSRRQKTLAVNIPYRGSKGPLHLLFDSTGIKVEGEGEWNARKPPVTHALHVLPGSGRSQTACLAQDSSRDHAPHDPGGQWMHCMKLLGQRLMARDFDRQVAEVQVRIAVMNGYTALGIPITEAVG